jgi:hypothetical protein
MTEGIDTAFNLLCSFIFDDEALEIKRNGEETENVVVGGQNRWPYR